MHGRMSLLILSLIAVGTAATETRAAEPARPNIVFVLIDDMGYGDLGCTGDPQAVTPNLDRIAAEGMRFTQFYVASPICSPSPVACTTGCFPARMLINSYLNNRERNRACGMRDWLDPAVPCVARTFQQAGYATAHFGKWHMGGGRDVGDAPLPSEYGFDRSLVSFEGLGDRILPPGGLSDQSEKLGRGEITRVPKHRQTEIYVDRAIGFLRENRERPCYLHLWLNDVHDAHRPSPEQLAKFEHLKDQPAQQQFYAVLAAMDAQLGRLFAAVDELGLAERTLLVVTSDNGPTAWPHYYKDKIEPPGSTAGFRGRKWSLYEGGIRMPLLVRWKGHTPAERVDEQSVLAAVDLFPTFCELAGIEPPEAKFDGEDVSPAFLGKAVERTKPLFWEYGRDATYLQPGEEHDRSPNLALRQGEWKLLLQDDGSRRELYNLAKDPREAVNLIEEQPELAAKLAEQLLTWRRSLPELEP